MCGKADKDLKAHTSRYKISQSDVMYSIGNIVNNTISFTVADGC